jgi:hypothetical protein
MLAPDEALDAIREHALSGRIRLSGHARRRMAERHVSFADVRRALVRPRTCAWQPLGGTWRVEGEDVGGEPLTVIAAVLGDVLVVTVF